MDIAGHMAMEKRVAGSSFSSSILYLPCSRKVESRTACGDSSSVAVVIRDDLLRGASIPNSSINRNATSVLVLRLRLPVVSVFGHRFLVVCLRHLFSLLVSFFGSRWSLFLSKAASVLNLNLYSSMESRRSAHLWSLSPSI